MEEKLQTLLERIDSRLRVLRLTDRKASMKAAGKPDLIRDIRRGKYPGGERLSELATALETTIDYLLGSEQPDHSRLRHTQAGVSDTNAQIPKLAYRIDEAVFATGLSTATLYRDIESGLLKIRKRGRSTIILAADLQSYLESFPEAK
jgi:hypothetical protein